MRPWVYLLAFSSLVGNAAFSRTESLPNIVLIFGDDLGRYASAYRDSKRPGLCDIITTPNMDRLAREGTLFQNAFVNVPSCTLCRASLISGRYFFRNGSHSQLHSPWPRAERDSSSQGAPDPWAQVRGFPLALKDAGYQIGWSYKMHISEDRMGGPSRNFRKAGSRFNDFSEHVSAASDPAAEKTKLLEEVRKNVQSFLADRKPNQPFFYWFNPTNTHRTWVKGSGKKLWNLDPDSLKGKLPVFLPDVHEVREDLTDYLGEVQAFDAAVGVLLKELESAGELDRSLVVVSGDHGIPGFTHGKTTLYDFGTQVPLIMRHPTKVAAKRVVSEPVSLIDLAPTFMEFAGLKPLADFNGQSLVPFLTPGMVSKEFVPRNWALHGRELHFPTARAGNLPYPSRAIRTPEYLYIVNFQPDRSPMGDPGKLDHGAMADQKTLESDYGVGYADLDIGPFKAWIVQHRGDPQYAQYVEWAIGKRPATELYRTPVDPDQVKNLAEDRGFQEVKGQLHKLLMEELTRNQDPRVLGDQFDRRPYLVPAMAK